MNRMLALLGTAECCKVRLHGSKVAPVHASLVSTAQGSWVVDLLSPTGTWVNGQRVRQAHLEDGDELRIGGFVMSVQCEPSDRFALAPVLPAAPSKLAMHPVGPLGQLTMTDLELPRREGGGNGLVANPPALRQIVEQTAKTMLESVVIPVVRQFSAVQDQMFDQFQQTMALMFQMFEGLQKEQMQELRAELTRVRELTREIQALHEQMKARVDAPPDLALREGASIAENPPTNGASHKSVPPRPNAPPRQSAEEVHALLCQRIALLQEDRRTRLQKIVDFLAGH